jgi:hypothetical protein
MFQPSLGHRFEFLRRRPGLGFSSGLALLLLVLFADPLLVPRTFGRRDMTPFFLPIEKAVHEAWRARTLPLLIPEISFGRPLAANPNTGVFYPGRVAMAALPFRFAFKFFPLFHLWIAGTGAFLLARFLGLSPGAAAVSGVIFPLSGPALSEIWFPDFLPGLALLPWVVWSAGRFRHSGSRRAAALFGLLLAVDLLVGDVFTAALAVFGGFLLVLQEPGTSGKTRVAGGLAAAGAAAILLAGIQIVPALLYLPYTVRALGRFPLRVALTWSVSLWRLLELLVPLPFGNAAASPEIWGDALWSGKSTGFFQTLYPGCLASGAILFFRPEKGKRLMVYGLMGLSLVVAAAGFYCPARLLSRPSPIPLRYPEKLMAGFELGGALLAGFAFDGIRRGAAGALARGSLAVALTLAAASLFLRLSPLASARFIDAHWSHLGFGARGAAALPFLLARAAFPWLFLGGLSFAAIRRKTAWPLAALALVALADVEVVRRQIVRTERDEDVFARPAAADTILALNHGQAFGFLPFGDYTIRSDNRARLEAVRSDLGSDFASAVGIVYAFNLDYDVSDPYRVELARREIFRDGGQSPGLQRFLAGYSARTALVEAGRMPNGFSLGGPTAAGGNWVVVNPAAVPTFRFAPRVAEVASAREAYSRIHDESADLSAVTVVETGRRRESVLSAGSLRVLRNDPDVLSVQTDAPGPSRVVLPRAPLPFRSVTVDGSPAEAEPANLCLSSVAVPPGAHEIVVRELLPGGPAGPAISLAGIAVLAGLCIEPRKK